MQKFNVGSNRLLALLRLKEEFGTRYPQHDADWFRRQFERQLPVFQRSLQTAQDEPVPEATAVQIQLFSLAVANLAPALSALPPALVETQDRQLQERRTQLEQAREILRQQEAEILRLKQELAQLPVLQEQLRQTQVRQQEQDEALQAGRHNEKLLSSQLDILAVLHTGDLELARQLLERLDQTTLGVYMRTVAEQDFHFHRQRQVQQERQELLRKYPHPEEMPGEVQADYTCLSAFLLRHEVIMQEMEASRKNLETELQQTRF